MTEGDFKEVKAYVQDLKREKEVLLLVHNYQRPRIQDIADVLGDSFGLALEARNAEAPNIVFCGVDFMAESAKVLNPSKHVVHPNKEARCPMAAMVDIEGLRELKDEHPGAGTCAYVNTTAETKAEVDVCCTSSNVLAVLKAMPFEKIIFVPDSNMGLYAQRFIRDKELVLWPGYCHVHADIDPKEIEELKKVYPDADVIAHPECTPPVIDIADVVASTEGMVGHIRGSSAKEFILATEQEMAYRLGRMFPDVKLITLESALCPAMKRIRFEDVLRSIETLGPAVELPDDIIERARVPLERMVAIGTGKKVDWG